MSRLTILLVVLWVASCAVPHVQRSGAAGQSPMMESIAGDHVVRASDGALLPLRIWPADEPYAAIIGVHGFNDYSMTFDAAGRWWSKRGLVTYAFDQRGFGAAPNPGIWPGRDRLVQDLEDVVAVVQRLHPDLPLYLHGNSMGGAVVLLALAERSASGPLGLVAGASLTAPAVWGGAAMNPLYRATLWLAAHTVPNRQVTGRGLGVLPSDNIEMLRALGRDPLVIKETRVDSVYGLVSLMGYGQRVAQHVGVPLLILYGAKDEVIPRKPTARLMASLPQSRAAVYPDGYHMLLRDLQAEAVWADVAAWIRNPVAPLPSGVEVDRTDPFAGR